MKYSIVVVFLLGFNVFSQSSGSIVDIDGNTYDYLTYGNKQWTLENANMETYRDGTPIPQVTEDSEWFGLSTGAWCYYNNDSTNGEIFGILYNYYAIIGKHDNDPNTPNKEFAPEDWRVSNENDWEAFELYLGMDPISSLLSPGTFSNDNTGSKLAGTESLWFNNPNNCSGGISGVENSLINDSEFNYTNFNWLPVGYRSGAWSAPNPSFCLVNEWGFLWSSDLISGYPRSRSITHNQTGLSATYGIFTYGRSVRFVRDYDIVCPLIDLGEDQSICNSSTVLLDATPLNLDDLVAVSYKWFKDSVEIIGEVLSTLTVAESGIYTAEVNADGCLSTDNIIVNFTSLTVDLGEDQEFCDVVSFEIIPDIVGEISNATYLWSTGETTSTIVVNTTGDYSVVVTAETCEVTASVNLLFKDSPLIDLGEDLETCFESDIVLDATPSNMNPDDVTYAWSTGATTPSIVVTEGGTYTVMASFGNCEVEDSITISARTDLDINVNDDFKSCVGEEWTLTATTSEEGITYQWYLNGDAIAGETSSTITFVVSEDFSGIQNYSVTITKGSCTGTDDVDIELYNVSNCVISQGISPDATPGFNDYLDLEFLSDRVGGITNLQIFNRYGTIVFNKGNYVNEWNGQDKNGNDLPTGTYYYVIDFNGVDDVYGPQTSGWIYLNRNGN